MIVMLMKFWRLVVLYVDANGSKKLAVSIFRAEVATRQGSRGLCRI